ncbi:MAG: HAMP domain-containing sensor histidine kinase [Sandaracinaceae bacterium]
MSSGGSERARRWVGSFGTRINAFWALLFVGTLVVLTFAADWATRRALEAQDRDAVVEELRAHGDSFASGGLDALRERLTTRSDARISLVRVRADENRTLLRLGPGAAPSDGTLDALAPSPTVHVVSTQTHRWTVAVQRVGDDHVMQVALSDAWRDQTLWELRRVFAVVLVVALLLGLLGGFWIMRRALRPVRALADTATRVVEAGDFSARVARGGTGDELDQLAAAFNRMLESNERLVQGMRDALDHVAHDLRTPLTRLRSGAEVALRSGDEPTHAEALADAIDESDRVLTMLRTLTDISEAETGLMKLDRQRVDLAAIAREVIDLYAYVAEDAGLVLAADLDEGVIAWGDAVRIRQALANLVDNAIKYSRADTEVRIEVRAEADRAVVRVRDEGPGIPEDALPRVFERLYRADASRTHRGLGLGLSFVRAIAEAHGGEVSATSVEGRGSTFTLALPTPA